MRKLSRFLLFFATLFLLSSAFAKSGAGIDSDPSKRVYKGQFAPSEGVVRGPETETRESLCLNGYWEFQPVYGPYDWEKSGAWGFDVPDQAPDLPPVDESLWEEKRIKIPSSWDQGEFFPSHPAQWEETQMAWLRKTFFVPSEWEDDRLILRFEAVSGDCKVFVNGKHVGGNFDSAIPFEFDLSETLVRGENNEVLIGIRSANLFKHETEYGKQPFPRGATKRFLGIWQDVNLLALPEVHIADVFVQPDVPNQVLRAEVTILNSSERDRKLEVSATVNDWINLAGDGLDMPEMEWELGNTALEMEGQKVKVPAQSEVRLILEAKVSDELTFWDIGQPNLYGMTASLKLKGKVVDRKFERFGWRDFRIEGDRFLVNGKEVQLLGDSQHLNNVSHMTRRFAWSWYTLLKDAGGNAARLHAVVFPRHFLDMADEMGVLILPESCIYGSTCDVNYASELFQLTARNNVEGMVRKYRNHACVFGWSIENEVLPALNVQSQDTVYKEWVYDFMGELAEDCRALDPTRNWISGDGSGDMDGRLPVYLVHYGSTTSYREDAAATDKPFGVGEACIAYYSTPRQSEMYVGDRAYRSYADHQDAIAIDAYELITVQREVGVFCSIWNLGYYSVEKLPFGDGRGVYFGKEYEEGKPGMQIEFLPSRSSQYNPGYDPDLPLYQPLPLFHAVKAAYNRPEPLPCPWDHREMFRNPPAPVFDSPVKEIQFVGDERGETFFHLKNAGLPLVTESVEPSVLLVDGDPGGLNEEELSMLTQAINGDAVVIFWGLEPANVNAINSLLPYPVEVIERKATALMKDTVDERVASIPYKDLYFSENTDTKQIMKYGLNGKFVAEGQVLLKASPVDWSRKNMNPQPEDPALVALPTGQGTIYLSTLNIDILTPAHVRMLSQLFTNMGIATRSVEFKRGGVFNQTSQLTKTLVSGCHGASTLKEAMDHDFLAGDHSLQPELDMEGKECNWQLAASKKGVFDLQKVFAGNGEPYPVAYLSFWVFSPRPLDEILADPDVPKLDLEISVPAGLRLWLNGKEQFSSHEPAEFARVKSLPIREGWNHFMVKVIGSTDQWNFQARLLSGDLDLLSAMRSALNPYSEKANFTVIRHTDPEIVYDQHWGLQGDGWYESATPGAEARFKFYGTGLRMTGLVFPKGGRAKLFIDGKYEGIIDYKRDVRDPHGVLFTTSGLPIGEHEVRLEVIDGWVALGPFEQWESYKKLENLP